MRKSKSFIVAMIIMLVVAMISLFVVSAMTYLFKWQADKAMIGIIVTYILVGFAGGFVFKRVSKKQNTEERKVGVLQKALETFSLSSVFMLLMIVLSTFVIQNPLEISGRLLMIWGLMTSSCFLGRIL
ncbi:MAG: hypothetical protein J6I97_09100 [Agathobacter sp.]|nr:hypothetical protein [Agathobacter sp.]